MKIRNTLSMMLFLLSITSVSIAQIPNCGFENWSTFGNGLLPDGWWCSNDSLSPSGTYFPVTRSTDHYPPTIGNYSIRLEDQPALSFWEAGGIAWTGGWSGNDYPAFAVTGHPMMLYGYFKYLPQTQDTMNIHIRLYDNGVDIAGGTFLSGGTVTSWTPFSIQFNSYVNADSARIMISAWDVDQSGFTPLANSVLYVDNLSFDTLITAGLPEVKAAGRLYVYPNPASGKITIQYPIMETRHTKLQLFNSLGQEVYSKQVSEIGEETLDVSGYADGIYFLRVTTEDYLRYDCKIKILNR